MTGGPDADDFTLAGVTHAVNVGGLPDMVESLSLAEHGMYAVFHDDEGRVLLVPEEDVDPW